MFVLGLQGSPVKNGSTDYLLSEFMKEAAKFGVSQKTIRITDYNIKPCIGCGYCEKKGVCSISDDDMALYIYPLLKKADIVAIASPVFFYGVTAQLKAAIDRCQMFWSRKYRFGLKDPKEKIKKGILLSPGASKGKNLFDGINLTAKYFFDAISAKFEESLCYKSIENRQDIEKKTSLADDMKEKATTLLSPLVKRKKILFICIENACRSQMAKAYAEYFAGDKIDVSSGGSTPASKVDPEMVKAMAEEKIDIAFAEPLDSRKVASETKPDIIVTMGCKDKCPVVSGTEIIEWDIPNPFGNSPEFMQTTRNRIKKEIISFLKTYKFL